MESFTQTLMPLFHVFSLGRIWVPRSYQPPNIVKILRYVFLVNEVIFYFLIAPFVVYGIHNTYSDIRVIIFKLISFLFLALLDVVTKIWMRKKSDQVKMLVENCDQMIFPPSVLHKAKWTMRYSMIIYFSATFILAIPFFIEKTLFEVEYVVTEGDADLSSLRTLRAFLFLLLLCLPLLVILSIFLPGQTVLILVMHMHCIIRHKFEYWVKQIRSETCPVRKLELLHNMCNDEVKCRKIFHTLDTIFSPLLALQCLLIIHGIPFFVTENLASSNRIMTSNFVLPSSIILLSCMVCVTFQTNIKLYRKVCHAVLLLLENSICV